MTTKPLKRVVITRTPKGWTVTREREKNGEACGCRDLEEAFDFVRALYDKDGEEKKEPVCAVCGSTDDVRIYAIMSPENIPVCKTCCTTWYESGITDPEELKIASLKNRKEKES